MKKLSLLSFIALMLRKVNHSLAIQRTVLALFLCFMGFSGIANVTVTPATSATICPTLAVGGGATAYTVLSNIVITEGATNDISFATFFFPDQLIIAPPTGWQFNTGVVPTLTPTGSDITSVNGSYSGGNLVISIVCGGTANINTITISNLQIEATSTSSFPGNITCTTDFGVTGITTGTAVPPATNFGAVQLNSAPTIPSVTISASPSGSVCFGTGILFTPAPTNGGAGPTYLWYINGVAVAPGSTFSSSTLSNGNTVATVMTSNAAGCVFPATATSNTVTATINPAPTTVTASGGGTFCGSTTITAANGGSGTIYFQGTTTGGTSTATPSTSQVVSSSGTYYFRAQSALGCWGTEGSVTVVINPVPAATIVSGGGTFCGGTPTITASGGGGGTIYFEGTTSGGTSTATPSSSQVISSSGTYYFNSQSAAGCWGTQGSAIVTINPGATANAGVPQTVCQGGSITLAGTIGGSASTSLWTASSGTFSDPTSLTATYTPTISSGSVTLTLTTNDPDGAGPCTPAVSSVVITVDQAATVNAGLPQTVCSNGTITLGGSMGGSASSVTWTASSGTFSNINSLSSTYTPTIASGPVTLTLTTNDPDGAGPCAAASSNVVVTIDQAATDNAGPTQTLCGGGTITLAGTTGGSATSSTWTAPSGSFSSASSLTSTYTPTITSGNVTLTLTTNDPDGAGPCTAATSTVIITVDQAATDNAGLPQTVCSSGSITLAGTKGGSATSSTWTASSGIFSNPLSLSSTYTPTISSGTVTLTLTTNDPDGAGPCPAATSTVVITVDQAATDNAGAPQLLCSGGTITLSGTTGGGATTSLWTAPSGTFSDVTSPTSTYTPSITSGNVTLTLTTNDPDGPGPCAAAVSSVVISVNQAATANAGPATTVCSNGTITLGGSIGGGATSSTWSASSGVFSNILSPTSTYTPGILTGTVALTLTTNDPDGAGPCIAATSTVVITVNTAALVNAGPAQTVCQGGTVTLNGSSSGSTTVTTWTGPSGVFSDAFLLNSTYTPSVVSGPVMLTLTSNDPDGPGPCTATTSTMTVTVNQAATDNAGVAQTVCAGGSVTLAGSLGGSATSGLWSASSGVFSSASSLTSTYTPSITGGVVTLTLTTNDPDGAGPCTSGTSTVNITVDPAATANAGLPQTVCAGGTITLAGAMGGSATSSTWSATSGSFSDVTSLTSTYTPIISSGTVTLTLTTNDPDGAGPCAAATSTVVVTVNPAATANAGVPQSVCAGGTITLAGSIGGSASTSTWNAASGVFSNVNSLTSTYTPTLTSGTITLTLTTNDPDGAGPCTSAVSTVPITINPLPAAVVVSGAGAYCTSETLTADNGGDGIIYYQGLTSGGTSLAFPSATEIETVTGTYYFRAQSAFGCWGPQGSAVVTINAIPTAFNVTGGGGYCTGTGGVLVGLSGSQAGISYQLYNLYVPLGLPVIGTGAPFNFGFETAGGFYTVIATNTGTSCTNNMTGGVAVALLPLPNIYTITGGGAYCAGGAGVPVGLTGSDVGINYQLLLFGVAVGTPVAGSGSSITFGSKTAAGPYTIVATDVSSGCTSTMTGTVTVTANILPTVFSVTGGGTQCAGGAGVTVGLSGSQVGFNYQLYDGSATSGLPFTSPGGIFNFSPVTTSGVYTVSATNPVTGCTNNMTGSALVTINLLPNPYFVTGGGGFCTGGAGVHVGLSNSDAGVSYQLFRGGGGLAALPGPGALDYGLQTVGGNYTVIATNTVTACQSAMTGTVTVTVNSLPNVYAVLGGGAYCAGTAGADVRLGGSDLGVNYQIYVGSVLTGSAVPGTGLLATLDLGMQTSVGTYSVSATNPTTGCTNNMTGSVNVSMNVAPPSFTVTGGGAECTGGGGFPIGLSGSTPGTYTYQLFNGSVAVTGAVPTTGGLLGFGTYTASGIYTVVATNTATGCTAEMSGSATITNYPLPIVETVSGGGTYCAGGAGVDIITSGSVIGTNYQVFRGSSTAGLPVAGTGSGLTILETAAGTYTITATDATTGCNSGMAGSATITVIAAPAAITGTTNICIGTSTTLTDASGAGTWMSNNVAVGTIAASGNVSGLSAGIYNITFTLNTTGCFTANIDTVTAMPVITPISGPSVVCQGSSVSLIDGSAGGVWTSGNILIASVGSTSGSVSGVNSGTVIISYTIAPLPGCSAATSYTETVHPSPALGLISGSTSLCSGLTILLNDATSGGSWSSSNTTVATVNSAGVVTGLTTGTVVISYALTNSYACTSTVTSAITVGAAMPPSYDLPVGSATICNGNSANMSVITTGGSVTYQWTIGGVDIPGANSSTYSTFTPGLYTCVISNGSCTEILPTINVMPQPAPVITVDTVTHYLYTGSFATYQWFHNGVLVAGASSNLIPEDTTAGTYYVVVSDANGCYDTSAILTIVADTSLSVANVSIGSIRIYPNPATSVLNIQAPEQVFVTIASPDGRVFMEKKEAVTVNISDLANGLYIVTIYDHNFNLLKTDRFVKMQ